MDEIHAMTEHCNSSSPGESESENEEKTKLEWRIEVVSIFPC